MSETSELPRKSIKNKSGMHFSGYASRREISLQNLQDGLTGLLNRKGWDSKVSDYEKHVARTHENVAFVVMDLDDFKKTNDTLGHQAGDAVLKEFADILRSVSRSSDIVARYGGDEFAVCLPSTSISEADIFKKRVLEKSGDIKLSIGVGLDFGTADQEMYRMKNSDV